MPKPGSPTRRKSSLQRLIDKYYADLADLARQNVFVEMGIRVSLESVKIVKELPTEFEPAVASAH